MRCKDCKNIYYKKNGVSMCPYALGEFKSVDEDWEACNYFRDKRQLNLIEYINNESKSINV